MTNRGDTRGVREYRRRVADERGAGPAERGCARGAGEHSEYGTFGLGGQAVERLGGEQHDHDANRPSAHPPIRRAHCSRITFSRGTSAGLSIAPLGVLKLMVNPGSPATCVARR